MTKARPIPREPFQTGLLSLDEWAGFWRPSTESALPAQSECDLAYTELSRAIVGCRVVRVDEPPYIRGDNFGDWTEYLELAAPDLRLELLIAVQRCLSEALQSQWRVIVSTYLGTAGSIVVYAQAIRFGASVAQLPPEVAVTRLAEAMAARG